jgi:RNA polymerase subunit RPABC4/transcription elongation factor Spt4
MWEYYCKKCKKTIDKDEMELREYEYEGDWKEFHIVCDSEVECLPKLYLKL